MRFAWLALGLGCLAAGTAHGDYYPLDENIVRRYEIDDDGSITTDARFFLGTEVQNGTTTHILHYVGGNNDGLLEYWSQDPTGDVYWHGWDGGQASVRFSPPLLWIDVPLFLGKTWFATSQTPIPHILFFQVVEHEVITVPAGSFECYTIEWDNYEPNGKVTGDTAPLGRERGANSGFSAVRFSVSDNIGLVQRIGQGPNRTERLLAIEDGTVGVELSTWSRVRQLYR